MGNFNPFQALMQGRALPSPPQVQGPVSGPRGGVIQPYVMPYQPNPVAETMNGVGQLLMTAAQIKESKRQQADQDVQQFIQMKSLGLPVDEKKAVKAAKGSSWAKFLDFSNPQPFQPPPQQGAPGQPQVAPAPGPGPQQMQAPNVGVDPRMAQALATPPPGRPDYYSQGGGLEQALALPSQYSVQATPGAALTPGQAGAPIPQAPIPGQAAPQRNPFQRFTDAMGFTTAPGGEHSQGMAALNKMAGAMGQQQQMGQNLQNADYQTKMMMFHLMRASVGVGPNDAPLDEKSMSRARQMLAGFGAWKLTEADDLNLLLQSVPPDRREPLTQAYVANKFHLNEQTSLTADIAKKLVDGGADEALAWSVAPQIASGRGVPVELLPSINRERLKDFIDATGKYHEMYPSAPQELWKFVDPLLLSGNYSMADKILTGAGGTPGATSKERREEKAARAREAEIGIASSNLRMRGAELGLHLQQFGEQRSQDRFSNGMRQMGSLLEAYKQKGAKLSDEEFQAIIGGLTSLMPGLIRPGTVDPGMFSFSRPGITPAPSADTGQKAPKKDESGLMNWIMKDLYPAIKESYLYDTKDQPKPEI